MRWFTLIPASTGSTPSTRFGLLVGGTIALAWLVTGCAFSESSGSISNSAGSISDSFGSSSDSSTSSSGDGDNAYREDVRSYTTAAAEAGAPPAALRRGVSELALERGVSDWEALGGTWRAIGEGLAAADISDSARRIYREALAPEGSIGDRAIEAGLASARP